MMNAQPKACVMGYKVAQSRSPMLHGYWLRTLGIAGSYERADLTEQEFPGFFRNLSANGFVGGNITKPYKEQAFALVDRRDAAATAIGAVNAVWYENASLIGSNTDAAGFLAHLDHSQPGWDRSGNGVAVVIGAGGAARAVVYGLHGRGFETAIVNRTLKRAQDLVDYFGPPGSAHGFADLPGLLPRAALLVNASALGALGQPPLEIDLTPLSITAAVYDINYVPLETDLLRAARTRGHPVVDGLGMLLHQAVPAFAKWFGRVPEVTADLRALIEADIRASIKGS